MRIHQALLISSLIFFSCLNTTEETGNTPAIQVPISADTTSKKQQFEVKNATIAEPFDLAQLEINPRLDFTSGGVAQESKKSYCENSENGFYGRYNLVDKQIRNRHPVIGMIDIYKAGKMAEWKSSDPNQKIWCIHLMSDVISLWDSIHVGLSRAEIVAFAETNQGFYQQKGDSLSVCDFNNFSVRFLFEQDTVRELFLKRKCIGKESPLKDK